MDPDPLEPPAAPADRLPIRGARAPVEVRNACWLILIALGLGFVTLIPGVAPPLPPISTGMAVFEAVWIAAFSALTYWLTTLLRRGSNRARWTLFVLLALGWLMVAATWPDTWARAPFAALVDLVVTLIEMTAARMLFSGRGAAWFDSPPR